MQSCREWCEALVRSLEQEVEEGTEEVVVCEVIDDWRLQ